LGGIRQSQLTERIGQAAHFISDQVARNSPAKQEEVGKELEEPIVLVPADELAYYDLVQVRGWGDGFPVLHPTASRVTKMLRAARISGDASVGQIPPRKLNVTAAHVATNAVLAGCPDAAFPVVLAGVRAALQEQFNLLGVLATTNPAGIGVLVSGRISDEIGMNAAGSLYGPGNRANATIGRAVRLACQNLGGARPGVVDKSTQGQPSKYSLCFAENLAASPWPAYHVDRGYAESDSTVTVIAAEGPINVHDPASTSAASHLQYLCGSMAHAGHNNLYRLGDIFLILCPEHAQMLARDGFSRQQVQEELFDRARVPARALGEEEFRYISHYWPDHGLDMAEYPEALLPLCDRAELIRIVVAGGAGKHTSWLPTFGITYSAIEVVA
jgi:hypothetical protein